MHFLINITSCLVRLKNDSRLVAKPEISLCAWVAVPRRRSSEDRPRGIPVGRLGKFNAGVVHPNAEVPPAQPWPEVVVLLLLLLLLPILRIPRRLYFFIRVLELLEVKPANASLASALSRENSAPLVSAGKLSMAPGPLWKGRVDKRDVEPEKLGHGERSREGGKVGNGLEGSFEKGLGRWARLGRRGRHVVGVDLDCG